MGQTQQKLENKAIGNLALDRYLLHCKPQPFLQRHLRLILDNHKHELEQKGTSGHNMVNESTSSSLEAWSGHNQEQLLQWVKKYTPETTRPDPTTTDSPHWHIGTRSQDNDSNRTISLFVHAVIVQPNVAARTPRSQRATERSDEDPEWLLDANDDQIRTTCTVSINEDVNGKAADTTTSASRECRLKLVQSGLHAIFDEPIRLKLPQLSKDARKEPAIWIKITLKGKSTHLGSLCTEAGSQETVARLQQSLSQYHVTMKRRKISVQMNSSSGMNKYDLGGLITGSSTKKFLGNSLPARATVLDAAMSVAVRWREQHALTPLSAFQEAAQDCFAPRGTQLPTPNASEDLEYDRSGFKITYIFMNRRRLVQRSLHCPLCEKDLGFETFTRLLLHFRVRHLHFSFDAQDDVSNEPGVSSKIILMGINSTPPSKANIRDKDIVKIDWIAPNAPFDEDAYVAGEAHWDQQRADVNSKAKKPARAITYIDPPPPPVSPRLVKPLNVRVPPLHPVPRVLDANGKQIRFYRTGSKKLLQPDELVAESDEEIDESWLQERQRQSVKRLRLQQRDGQAFSQAEQDFIIDWNNHITQEQRQGANSDRLKRDSIIRFAQRHHKKLSIPGWRDQFEALLQRMVQRRICTEHDMEYCLTHQDASQSTDVVDGSTQSHLTTRTRRTSDDEEADAKTAMDLCVCGERVFSTRGIIYCANVVSLSSLCFLYWYANKAAALPP